MRCQDCAVATLLLRAACPDCEVDLVAIPNTCTGRLAPTARAQAICPSCDMLYDVSATVSASQLEGPPPSAREEVLARMDWA